MVEDVVESAESTEDGEHAEQAAESFPRRRVGVGHAHWSELAGTVAENKMRGVHIYDPAWDAFDHILVQIIKVSMQSNGFQTGLSGWGSDDRCG